MQITLDINDNTYNTLIKSGIDIKEQLKEYIATLAYKNTKEYQENKAYFQSVLDDVESGKAKLISQSEYDKVINEFEAKL